MNNLKIKIIKNGPYLVQGNIPLKERFIIDNGLEIQFASGQELPQAEEYMLCRCGKSGTMPFCDGAHTIVRFDGTETASKTQYSSGEVSQKKRSDVKDLAAKFDIPVERNEVAHVACTCPTVMLDTLNKDTSEEIEPVNEPSIYILHDPERQCIGAIWVRGDISIESSDGTVYETHNRVNLCSCGKSENKPFCDTTHSYAKVPDVK